MEDLLPRLILGPYIKCRSHVISSCARYIATNRKKVKPYYDQTFYRQPNNCSVLDLDLFLNRTIVALGVKSLFIVSVYTQKNAKLKNKKK
jgi:hypothetical protein